MSQPFVDHTREIIEVFDADGKSHKASRANAYELIKYSGFTFHRETVHAEEVTTPAEEKEEVIPAAEVEDTKEEENTLEAEAKNSGEENVEDYLRSMTDTALRLKMEEDFKVKPHHKTSKDNLVKQYLELLDKKEA